MRIAIIADPYVPVPPNKYGGAEQVIHYLIKGLLEEGHEPILVGPGDSRVPCELIATVPQAIPFPKSRIQIEKHKKQAAAALKKTEVILNTIRKRVDIIHSHTIVHSDLKLNFGFDMRSLADFPNVTTLHSPIQFGNITYYLERKHLNYISISDNQRRAFPALRYVSTVYNGEDPSMFPIITKPKSYLCFLGRIDRDKNPHLAIQLALALNMPLKLAGKIDHSGESYFAEEIEPYLGHPLIEYAGELNFEDKVELLSKALCNLHPTGFREPFGLTIIEAAYCGTPTLAISKGSMPELIEDGRTGVLVEDFVEGFHQIEKCFHMDRKYVASRARTLFNYKTMTRQYVCAYEQVLEAFKAQKAQVEAFRRLTKVLPKKVEPLRPQTQEVRFGHPNGLAAKT